ncbi:hypothetical protein, partial [Ellagibacter isourolithinifaciens]|uniref:hypothetical protein n=1 Tax=Ellagibacter isourolithinifaciens TaxID=2137581 RepID=UPI003A8F5421
MASVAWKSSWSRSSLISKSTRRGQKSPICEELHSENFMLKFLTWENAWGEFAYPLIRLRMAHISELRQKVGPVGPVGAEAALYTDEDKVFCVKRMWAEGLTPTAASRLWGAPSRRTLAAWEKEALGGGLAVEAP